MISNFTLTDSVKLSSSEATIREYTHTSGAKLVYFDNGAEEKAFATAFKTIPSDSTGVFHILEHSVLSGSENYPISSPILYMLKNSMQTFLNALTFQGKTIYPCASCNEKDFINLMKVYLDAVFKPLLSHDTFMREGWHLEPQGDKVAVSGVVYNEMNGAMSSPVRLVYQKALEALYPDTYQAFNSGGAPEAITDLSYEQYLAAYKEYYSVKNCVVLLSGKQDLERTLSIIDGYLSEASKGVGVHEYDRQEPVCARKEFTYTVTSEADLKDNAYLCFGYHVSDFGNEEDFHVASLLYNILLSENTSLLKSALLKSGLMGDVETVMTDEYQRAFLIICLKADAANRDKIQKIIDDTLLDIVKKGLDKSVLRAALAEYSFQLKEMLANLPLKPVESFFRLADNAFYHLPLNAFFECDGILKKMQEYVEGDAFEKAIERIFIENRHTCVLSVSPALGDPAAEREALYQRALGKLSSERIGELIKEFKDFAPRMGKPDSAQAVAAMPSLEEGDLSAEYRSSDPERTGEILFTEADTGGIVYRRDYFDISALSEQELSAASFLASALSSLPTINKSAAVLADERKLTFGRISYHVKSYTQPDRTAKSYFDVTSAFFEENCEKAKALLEEILTQTDFSQEHLKDIFRQELSLCKLMLSQDGMRVAIDEAGARISPAARRNCLTSGVEYYAFLQSFEGKEEELSACLSSVAKKIFTKANALIGVTGKKEYCACRLDLPEGEKKEPVAFSLKKGNAAFGISSTVNYNVKAFDYTALMPYSGKNLVLANLLRLGYLWHNVREKGNAYGTSLSMTRDGVLSASSYRDPQLKKTYEVYDGIASFLSAAEISEKEILGCKMSVVGSITKPATVEEKSLRNEGYALSGLNSDDIRKVLQEAISFSVQDIGGFIKLFEEFAANGVLCTVGSSTAERESGLFDEITDI